MSILGWGRCAPKSENLYRGYISSLFPYELFYDLYIYLPIFPKGVKRVAFLRLSSREDAQIYLPHIFPIFPRSWLPPGSDPSQSIRSGEKCCRVREGPFRVAVALVQSDSHSSECTAENELHLRSFDALRLTPIKV
jgi:hypothetical protein